ncbi:DUF6731 family protein [Nonomuraea guangzhouensis]|uniref:DUF6731 family protein n=1 Tax=Nonomuraea guangzhouensis TaxID=1291555 RepID=A0ABW4GFL3_9ACTN|nr:DUF6731 family protein [Nonomuraea guangzhouensis]
MVKPFPFEELRAAISELPDHAAYVKIARMEILGSTHEVSRGAGAKPEVPLVILDRINRAPSVRIERRRNYRPLILEDDETLAEPAFYSIFDNNILAIMRNDGSAPGPASFRDYVNRLTSEPIEISSLVDRNALRALHNVRTLTKLHIEVGPDVVAEVFSSSRLIAEPLDILRRRLGSVGIEVSLKMSPKGPSDTSEQVLQDVRSLVEGSGLSYVEKAQINYRSLEDGRAKMYDFLSEAVTTSVDVDLDARTNQPTELSAAQSLADAYDKLYEDIRAAYQAATF